MHTFLSVKQAMIGLLKDEHMLFGPFNLKKTDYWHV
jgi:hypothetical protein